MVKILISDKLNERGIEVFKERGVEVDFRPGTPAEELLEIIKDYDGLVVRSATKVTPEVLAAATNLKVVGRAGIGVDNINIPAASSKGVVVMNTPFGNAITTAEHAIALMFSLARNIPQASSSTHLGKWEKSKFVGTELFGKVLGIIGCGNIGAIVADRAQGIKMKVIAFDPYLSEERACELGVERVTLDELLERSDVITLHVPLTEQTRGILDREALEKTKKGVLIVNCARGGLIDEAALREFTENGQVGGAAIDVYEKEPATENVMFGAEKIICTPHLGASTAEAQVNVAVQVAEQMSDYLLNGGVSNALNMPNVSAEDAARLKPYLELAEQVGSFSGQIMESSVNEVEIIYSGAVAEMNIKPLTSVILKNLLSPIMESVNMVNAPIIAAERDIKIAETLQSKNSCFHNQIKVNIKTDQRNRTVSGTLFDGRRPRLVEIDGVEIEIEVTPHMLFVRNEDKPGFIGSLGCTLGDADINIASFDLGRSDKGGEAICLISVDDAICQKTLAKISKIENVIQAKALSF